MFVLKNKIIRTLLFFITALGLPSNSTTLLLLGQSLTPIGSFVYVLSLHFVNHILSVGSDADLHITLFRFETCGQDLVSANQLLEIAALFLGYNRNLFKLLKLEKVVDFETLYVFPYWGSFITFEG